MLTGKRREGESFVLKKSKVSALSSQFLSFGATPIIPPITDENRQRPSNTTKEKESEAEVQRLGMGDATSNHPVLATGDAGQSNLGGGATNSAAGGFVALDVGSLSSLAGEVGPPEAAAAVASPRPPRTPKVVRSLSRKGERKPAEGDGNGNAGSGGGERPQLFVHVAAGDIGDGNGARLVVHTPVASTPSGKSRRLGRRPAPWLDPRRVVFLFATLSSVGTLILLYFTLSMSRTDSSGDGAAATGTAR